MRKSINRPTRAKRTAVRRPVAKVNKRKALIASKVAKITRAFEEEAEDVLEQTEDAVKECVPCKAVKASLARTARKLSKEGVSAKFDATMSRTAMRRTAEEVAEVTVEEAQEAVDAIVDVVVDEFENLLADVDEVADDTVDEVVEELDDAEVAIEDVEDEVKTEIESKLAAMGVKCRLARKHASARKAVASRKSVASRKPVARKTVAKKVNPILAKAKRKMSR